MAPFVVLLSKPQVLHTNAIARQAYAFFGFGSEIEAITAFAFLMIGALAISNVMAGISVWITYRFSLSLGSDLQRDLLNCYFGRPYVELAGTNSADLINKIAIGAPRFAFNVMQPLMIIASQGAIVLVIVVGVLTYQPTVVLTFVALIGSGYGFLFLVVRKKLLHHGAIIWQGGEQRQRLLTEGLGALKEIRLARGESNYKSAYQAESDQIYASEALVGVLADVPRFLLETVAFTGLLLIAVIQLRGGESTESVIATLSVFAMTSYRLLPAGQAIFKSFSQIRANAPIIRELSLDVAEGRRLASMPTVAAGVTVPEYPADIRLRDVWFTYPRASEPVLCGVSAVVPAKCLTVVVGASGSGKSTLSDLLLGLLPPDSGNISVGEVELRALGRNWFGAVGYVPQSIFILDDTIERNIAFGSTSPIDQPRLERSLRLAHLWGLVESVPEGTKYRVGERGSRLSGGQRQRLGIARALYHDAHYLILDEATSALDGRTEADVIATLHHLRAERTVLMIAHRLSTIQAADHIIFLREGRVAGEGTFASLSSQSAEFRRLVAAVEVRSYGADEGVAVIAAT